MSKILPNSKTTYHDYEVYFPIQNMIDWLGTLPRSQVFNMDSPTECAIASYAQQLEELTKVGNLNTFDSCWVSHCQISLHSTSGIDVYFLPHWAQKFQMEHNFEMSSVSSLLTWLENYKESR